MSDLAQKRPADPFDSPEKMESAKTPSIRKSSGKKKDKKKGKKKSELRRRLLMTSRIGTVVRNDRFIPRSRLPKGRPVPRMSDYARIGVQRPLGPRRYIRRPAGYAMYGRR